MENKRPYICLIIGCITYALCCGRYNIAIFAWIWPFMLLYFMRNTKGKKSILLLLLTLIIGYGIKFYGLLGDMGLMLSILISVIGVIYIIPFIIDKFFYKKVPQPWNTLIFPLSWASLEVLKSYTFFGTMGNVAYSQAGNLPLIQMTGIFGSFGLTVLILWLGTILLYAVENNWNRNLIKKPTCAYLAILIGCFSYGGIRLLSDPVYDETYTLACAYGPELGSFGGDYETLSLQDNMKSLEKSAKEAEAARADVLMWCEDAFCIADTDEDKIIQRAQELARQSKMYYIFPIEVEDSDNSEGGLSLNMLLVITPEGEIIDSYRKKNLVPFLEAGYYVEGDEAAKTHETPYGKISSVICFDCTFIHYINKVCSKGTDTLFVPSWDWREILTYNTKDVEFRAVENGVNLARTTYDGLTEVVDAKGRILAGSDTFSSGFEYITYAQVPTKGITTIYSMAGQFIPWAYIGALAVLLIIGEMRQKRR